MRKALTVALLLSSCALHAQGPVELSDSDADLWDHVIGPRSAIHADHSLLDLLGPQRFDENVVLEVVVSINGRVDSAKPVSGPQQLYDQAVAIEESRIFKPFQVGGNIVPVRIHDYVSVEPPEVWASRHVAVPDQVDLGTLRISLKRTGCYGTCPSYRVTVSGDGLVCYEGDRDVLVNGAHAAHISSDAVRELLSSFRKADFLSALDEYRALVTDSPTQTLSLIVNGRTKTVVDYVGSEVGLPDAVKDLERQVDERARIERWVKGDETTVPSLKAEHFPFGAATPENMRLYVSAIQRKNAPLVEEFIRAKAPVDLFSSEQYRPSAPICAASQYGDEALVRRMLEGRKQLNPQVLQPCLAASVQSGHLRTVNLWLDRGARPVPELHKAGDPNSYQEPSAFAFALRTWNVPMIERLLAYHVDLHEQVGGGSPLLVWAIGYAPAGAEFGTVIPLLVSRGLDVNERDERGETALFANGLSAAGIRALIAAGASVDTRDRSGRTALIRNAFIEDNVCALLEVGADPTIAANDGTTALKQARQFGCPPCAQLIEKAVIARSQPAGK